MAIVKRFASLLPALIGIICGFFAHKTDRVFKEIEVENARYWTRQGRYIVGVLSAMPAYLVFREQQKDDSMMGNALLFFGAFGSVGIGVQLGYLYDYLKGKNGIGRG